MGGHGDYVWKRGGCNGPPELELETWVVAARPSAASIHTIRQPETYGDLAMVFRGENGVRWAVGCFEAKLSWVKNVGDTYVSRFLESFRMPGGMPIYGPTRKFQRSTEGPPSCRPAVPVPHPRVKDTMSMEIRFHRSAVKDSVVDGEWGQTSPDGRPVGRAA